MSFEECEVLFMMIDGILLKLLGLEFDLGILSGYHLAVNMRVREKKTIKYRVDNLSPRELNGAEWEKEKFVNEQGAGVIAGWQVLYSGVLFVCVCIINYDPFGMYSDRLQGWQAEYLLYTDTTIDFSTLTGLLVFEL